MTTLQITICSLLFIAMVLSLAFVVIDCVLFCKAANQAIKQHRESEFIAEPELMRTGTGFRLYLKFKPAKK